MSSTGERPSRQPSRPHARHPALVAWLRLARLNGKLLRASARRLEPAGLSLMEFDILAHVGAAPDLTQQRLSERLFVTEGNVTYQLAKLERRGLVARHTAGRCKRLRLTDRGRALYDDLVPWQEAWHTEQFGTLTDAEQRQLLGLLRKLEHAL